MTHPVQICFQVTIISLRKKIKDLGSALGIIKVFAVFDNRLRKVRAYQLQRPSDNASNNDAHQQEVS
jgi:hypothetical protein